MAIQLKGKGLQVNGMDVPAWTILTGLSPDVEAALVQGGDATVLAASANALMPAFFTTQNGVTKLLRPDGTEFAGGGSAATDLTWRTQWDTSGNFDLGERTLTGATALTSTTVGSVRGGQMVAEINSAGFALTVEGVAMPQALTWMVVLVRAANRHLWVVRSLDNGDNTTTMVPVSTDPATRASAPTLTLGSITASSVPYTLVAPASNGGAAITDYVIEYQIDGGAWTVYVDGVGTGLSGAIPLSTSGAARAINVRASAENGVAGVPAYGMASGTVPAQVVSFPGFAAGTNPLRAGYFSGAAEAASGSYWLYTFPAGAANVVSLTKDTAAANFAPGVNRFIAALERVSGGTLYWSFECNPAAGNVQLGSGYKPTGLFVNGGGASEVLMTALPANAAAGTWSQGSGWASLAAHANTALMSAKLTGAVMSVESSIDGGATWVQLAKYTFAAAPTSGIIYGTNTGLSCSTGFAGAVRGSLGWTAS